MRSEGRRNYVFYKSSCHDHTQSQEMLAPGRCAMRWMPQNKGYISGFVVAGFGLSATIFQIVQKRLVNPDGAKPTLTPCHAGGSSE